METSITVNNSPVSSNKTYLQQCVEDMDPSLLSSSEKKSTLWQVASIATLVAFTVLAVGGLALCAAYAPLYIPLVAITSAFLLKYAKQGAKTLESWSEQARGRAEQLKEISKHYQALSSASRQLVQQALLEKGVAWYTIPGMALNPAGVDTLKPLIARHTFWENRVKKLEEEKSGKLTEATKLAAKNYEANKDTIYELRSEALEVEKIALESKVKNAFINAVIRRPDFKGTLEDMGTFSPMSGQERAIANGTSPASATEFFTFKDGRTPTIAIDEVRRMGITDLAMRLISGMAA
jgi:hypothetical protein